MLLVWIDLVLIFFIGGGGEGWEEGGGNRRIARIVGGGGGVWGKPSRESHNPVTLWVCLNDIAFRGYVQRWIDEEQLNLDRGLGPSNLQKSWSWQELTDQAVLQFLFNLGKRCARISFFELSNPIAYKKDTLYPLLRGFRLDYTGVGSLSGRQ